MRQTSGLLVLAAVLALSATVSPAGQRGAPPPTPGQAPPPTVGTGFIAGQVIDVPSGKGIPEAQVTIYGRPSGAPQGVIPNPSATADARGRFFFASLPAGRYFVGSSKAGYTSGRFVTATIILADGERVVDVAARLMKVASLSGTVRDEAGDPVVATDVLVLLRYLTNGRPEYLAAGKRRTDDRGHYRVANLPPGDYVVCACSREVIPFDGTLLTTLGSEPLQLMTVAARALSVGSDVVSLDDTLRTFPPTLHPSAPTFSRATKVMVAPGEDKLGVDITLPFVRSVKVSGRVTGALSPVQAWSMRLVRTSDGEPDADLLSIPPMLAQADGRFDFAMVPPGQYRLVVLHHETGARSGGPSGLAMGFVGARGATPPASGAMAGAGADMAVLWADEPVTVDENGVSNLVVSLNRALRISGRVQWIGAAPPPPQQALSRGSVTLQSDSAIGPFFADAGFFPSRVTTDATFLMTGVVPGKYIVRGSGLPGYPTLKSVTVGGRDITDMTLAVEDKDIAEVVLTYVDAPMAALTIATVPPPPGPPPVDEPSIVVFPVDRKFWAEPDAAERRFGRWPVTPQGTTVTQLPAGDYFVMRLGSLEAMDWMEASKLDVLSRRAQRVTVPETGSVRIDLRR